MTKKKLKVLVTGGAGFIGSHVLKRLKHEGYTVVVLDSLENGFKKAVLGSRLIIGNLSNRSLLDRVFVSFKPDAVMHFAAYADVPLSVKDPHPYYLNNISNGLNLLNCMVRHKVKHIIFSSSAAVYGQPNVLLIPEEHPKFPTNPYGRTKLYMEEILRDFGVAYGVKSVSLRYFCAAGCAMDGSLGESHNPERHLIPVVLRSILGVVPHVKVCGTDYPTADGTGVRDYIHVDDLAEAHVKSLDYLFNGGDSDSFNVGIGKGYSVLEIINKSMQVSGRNVPYVLAERRAGDPASLVADPSKIIKKLGWKPKYGLNEIISSAWSWQSSHPKGYSV